MKKRILVIRFGSLGDVLLTSAPLVNLRISFPDHEIVYLTKKQFAPIVEMFGTVDVVLTIPDKSSTLQFIQQIRKLGRYDIVVDLHGNMRSMLARMSVKATRKVTYPKRRRERWLLTRRKKKIPAEFPHTIDLYNIAVSSAGGSLFCRRPLLKISQSLVPSGIIDQLKHDGPIIVVAPGAAHPTKQWPMERFAEVAVTLYRECDASIIWVGMEKERAWPELRSEFSEGRFVECIGEPLEKLAQVIARANVTIVNDSGIAHLSSSVGTPVVAIFGPTHQALGFAPRGLRDYVVDVDESCRPCSRHGRTLCYREERFCFNRIATETVSQEVKNILDKTSGESPALFVDRDGTLIVDKHFLSDPDQIEFIDGSVEALKHAQQLGFKIVVVSNQSGVARGLFDENTVEQMNARLAQMLAQQGVELDAIYYCPHHKDGKLPEYSIACNCRKPAPGMLEEGLLQLKIDLKSSYMVGDKLDDLFLGYSTAVTSLLVRTGKGIAEEKRLQDFDLPDSPEVFDNLFDAVKFIEKDSSND